jgi:hypothetical protein
MPRTKVDVNERKGVIGGMSVHNIHKREVLFSRVCTFKKHVKNIKSR